MNIFQTNWWQKDNYFLPIVKFLCNFISLSKGSRDLMHHKNCRTMCVVVIFSFAFYCLREIIDWKLLSRRIEPWRDDGSLGLVNLVCYFAEKLLFWESRWSYLPLKWVTNSFQCNFELFASTKFLVFRWSTWETDLDTHIYKINDYMKLLWFKN